MTSFTARRPALRLPPAPRASRWQDTATANRFTTEVLRANEHHVRAAMQRSEPFVEFRSAAPADSGTLFVRNGSDLEDVEINAAVVRMDLSGPAPVVLASYPECLAVFDDAWDLLQLLTRCGTGAAEYWDDPRAAVDAGLAGDPRRAGVALSQWKTLLGENPDDDQVRDLMRRVDGSAEVPPEGVSWSDWGQWFAAHLTDVAETRTLVTPAQVGATPSSRTADFDAVDVGDLVGAVLDVAPVHPVTRRFVVRAEVGSTVGTVTTSGPDLVVAASGLAVVLTDGADGRQILDAHPELRRPAGLLDRFPLAAALLPAYFGPSLSRVDVLPWVAQRSLLTVETDDVVAGFVRDLEHLAQLQDEGLADALRGLGSAVVPTDARAWMARLTWRARRFRWEA